MVIPFTARVVMFAWRFVSSEQVPPEVFYAFAYAVPELVPLVIQLYVTRERKKVDTEGQAFIENLYAHSHSDHIGSFLLQSDAVDSSSVVNQSQGIQDVSALNSISPIQPGREGILADGAAINPNSLDGGETEGDLE